MKAVNGRERCPDRPPRTWRRTNDARRRNATTGWRFKRPGPLCQVQLVLSLVDSVHFHLLFLGPPRRSPRGTRKVLESVTQRHSKFLQWPHERSKWESLRGFLIQTFTQTPPLRGLWCQSLWLESFSDSDSFNIMVSHFSTKLPPKSSKLYFLVKNFLHCVFIHPFRSSFRSLR